MFSNDLPIDRIRTLAADQAFLAAVAGVYHRLDERIAARNPICTNRGNCCKFAIYKHKLFVTPVELSFFIASTSHPKNSVSSPDTGACPYQQSGLCTARDARPIGCRIFHCDEKSQGWQPQESESALRELEELHVRFMLPYAYVEWLGALRQLRSAAAV